MHISPEVLRHHAAIARQQSQQTDALAMVLYQAADHIEQVVAAASEMTPQGELRVEITSELGQPTRCQVWRGNVKTFEGVSEFETTALIARLREELEVMDKGYTQLNADLDVANDVINQMNDELCTVRAAARDARPVTDPEELRMHGVDDW